MNTSSVSKGTEGTWLRPQVLPLLTQPHQHGAGLTMRVSST